MSHPKRKSGETGKITPAGHPLTLPSLWPTRGYYDLRREVIEPSIARGEILAVPIISIPKDVGIPSDEWATNPERLVYVVRKGVELFDPSIILPPMDLTVFGSCLGIECVFPPPEEKLKGHPVQLQPSKLSVKEALERFTGLPDDLGGTSVGVRISTVKSIKSEFPGKVVGEYVPGPLTLAGDLADYSDLLEACIDDRPALNKLLERTTDMSVKFAQELTKAGASVIGVLDPVASGDVISLRTYAEIRPHTDRVVDGVHKAGATALLHVCGYTKDRVESMCKTGADILSMDCRPTYSPLPPASTKDIQEVLTIVEKYNTRHQTNIYVMTGLPTLIYKMTVDDVRNQTKDLIELAKKYKILLLSTTCEIPESTPRENISTYMKLVREARRQ